MLQIIGWPFLGMLLLFFVPRGRARIVRGVSVFTVFMSLVTALYVFIRFSPGQAGFQFEQTLDWIPALGVSLHVGVDGLNLGLLVMAALVAFASVCISREVKTREKEFYILLLMMTGGAYGMFAVLDLLFFYVFHELALVPTFIMIGVWGRGERRVYAAYKMAVYLSLGALLVLVGFIAIYVAAGAESFDIPVIAERLQSAPLSESTQSWIFAVLMFGFGILVALWPFHTWAPQGYASAPTPVAMLHAGVLKKFGLYGLISIALPLMPAGAREWLPVLAWLCVGNLLYCGLVAMRQKDLNLLIGNSSVAHMGFVFLGIASYQFLGITGAIVVMIAHGLLAALSFGLSGHLYNQKPGLRIGEHTGLLKEVPFVGTALIMAMLAGCGVPGFLNFVGELLVFFGAWGVVPWITVVCVWAALVVGAVYMLRAIRYMLHGTASNSGLNDINGAWLRMPYALLLGCLLLLGVYPGLLLRGIKPAVDNILPASDVAQVMNRGEVVDAMPITVGTEESGLSEMEGSENDSK